MSAQSIKVHGYWLALLPTAVFIFGVLTGAPWLVAVLFFLVMPLVRLNLPDDPSYSINTDEISLWQFRALKLIPWLQGALMGNGVAVERLHPT